MTHIDVDDGRETLAAITACLVEAIDLRRVSKWQPPGIARLLRESLLWRVEELAQTAYGAVDSDRFVSAALAARAVMETTAGLVFLDTLMKRGIADGVSEPMLAKLKKFFINSKVWDDLDDPIHINDMLREVEKVIPGYFETHYANLSESAHPNWAGTFGAFGQFDKVNVLAHFSQGGRSPEVQRKKILANLAATLGLAKGYYEMIEGKQQPFVEAVDAYFAANPPADVSGAVP